MSEIKPVYQLRVRFNLWEDQTKEQYEDSKFGDGVPRILYPAAAYEALQKENAELKHINLTSLADLHFKNRDLEDKNAEQAKRIEEHLELIEATAEFSKAFWEKADKHSDTRVMVSTFQQLERKLRTYLPASKNGE